MPSASTKVQLNLAKNVGELNKLATDIPKVLNARLCVKSAGKLFQSAEDFRMKGDEERAYVMYMKYFNLISSIKKTVEYKKNEQYYKGMIGTKNCIAAINQAEALAASLKNRYDEREAEEVSRRLQQKAIKEEEKVEEREEKKPDKVNGNVDESDDKPEENAEEMGPFPGSVSVQKLYKLLTDGETKLLILDVRGAKDFEESRISKSCCVNIPCEIVPPGSTVRQIEKNLPPESESQWSQRDQVDYIIILDWYSSVNKLDIKSHVKSLKDALHKWDSEVTLKREPLVLEGGFDDWLTFYPTFTTNARVKRPPKGKPTEAPVSLDKIEYDLELSFLKPPEPKVKPKPLDESTNQTSQQTPNNVPQIDRSKKPKPGLGGNINNTSKSEPNVALNNAGRSDQKMSTISSNTNFKINDISDSSSKKIKPKNINLARQGSLDSTRGGSPVPSLRRSLKPDNANVPETTPTKVNIDSISAAEVDALHKQTEDKKEELNRFRSENTRLVAEHKARVARLESDQHDIDKLASLKQKEIKETAELMRKKKKVPTATLR